MLLAALAMGMTMAMPSATAYNDPGTKTSQSSNAKQKKVKKNKSNNTKVVITGSRLPQEVKPGKGIVTAAPVDIITSDQIRRMGATSLPFVLSRQTSFR